MDFGSIIRESFAYTKEGVFSRADRWLKLILAVIPLGILMNGYSMRIYRNSHPAPEVDQWGTLFIDGLKLTIVGILYAIPILVLWCIVYSRMLIAFMNGDISHIHSAMSGWTPNIFLLVLLYIVEIIVGILAPIAYIRFARAGKFSEAFNFTAIIRTIGTIGWINYIIALILVSLIIGIPVAVVFGVLMALGILTGSFLGAIIAGVILLLVFSPLLVVFQARYMTQVYNVAESTPATSV